MYAYVKNIKQIKWNGLLALVSLCLSIVSFLVIIELYKVKSIEREQFMALWYFPGLRVKNLYSLRFQPYRDELLIAFTDYSIGLYTLRLTAKFLFSLISFVLRNDNKN